MKAFLSVSLAFRASLFKIGFRIVLTMALGNVRYSMSSLIPVAPPMWMLLT